MPDSGMLSQDQLDRLITRIAEYIPPSPSRDEEPESKPLYSTAECRLIAAYEAALTVASQVHPDDVMQRLVDEAITVVHADVAMLTLTGKANQAGRVILSGGRTADVAPDDLVVLHGARIEAVAPVFTPGLDEDSRLSSLVGVSLGGNGAHVGTLFMARRAGRQAFDEEDLRAIEIMARHASATIERATMYHSVEHGQAQLGEQFSQLRTIMDTLPAGVLVVLPPDGRIESCNRTAVETILGGQTHGERLPMIYRDFRWLSADGRELPRSRHPGMRALEGKTIPNRALMLQTSTGQQIPVRVQSAPIFNGTGEVTRAVVMFLDVSRERAAEQVKDDFLSLISHEFRTPLTAIHGGAHLLAQQGDVLDEETRSELLQDIGEESSRLDRMLGNLLSVSEIMAGRFQASTEPILVAPFVQPVVDEFRRRASEHRFTIEVESDIPPAEGDPELLIQILRNLYENAVKYSPGGGDIRTGVRCKDGWVAIEVIDSGLGIAPGHVPHVFERFRRPGADPTVRGMGLGLYLSRLLVDAQGGRIRAISEGPGKGATFIVELPVVPDWGERMDTTISPEHTS